MAIDSKTINEGSQPIGIPNRAAPRQVSEESMASMMMMGSVGSYGSSPPVRLPSFATPNEPKRSSPRLDSSVQSPSESSTSGSSGRRRQPRRNVLSPAYLKEAGLEVLPNNLASLEDDLEAYDPFSMLSTSFFSTLSLHEEEDDDDGGDAIEDLCESLLGSVGAKPLGTSTLAAFNRISKQGRKLLRSPRLPLEHVLEFETLILDQLYTKTPRSRPIADAQHSFTLSLQNPYRRSLLHSICQYYRLASQTLDKASGLILVRATNLSFSMIAEERLSTFLSSSSSAMSCSP